MGKWGGIGRQCEETWEDRTKKGDTNPVTRAELNYLPSPPLLLFLSFFLLMANNSGLPPAQQWLPR